MGGFTLLEAAALRSIIDEAPEHAAALAQQVAVAEVVRRTNTGAGFVTEVALPTGTPPAAVVGVLGRDTQARIEGLEHGLGFVLFLEGGHITALEGHAWGPESTAALNLRVSSFNVFRARARPAGGLRRASARWAGSTSSPGSSWLSRHVPACPP